MKDAILMGNATPISRYATQIGTSVHMGVKFTVFP